MDPVSALSVAQATGAAIRTCTTVTKAIYNFVQDVKNVDESTNKIKRDVEGLGRVLPAVKHAVERFQTLRIGNARPEEDILAAVNGSVADCDAALKKLINILGVIRGRDSPNGRLLARVQQTTRLDLQRQDLEVCRLEIEQHKASLNLSLHVVTVTLCSEISLDTERPRRLQDDPLLKMVGKLRSSLDNLYPASTDQAVETANRRMLKKTAKRVLSNSVYAASREDSSALSYNGDNLKEDNDFVESWLSRLSELEEEDAPSDEHASTSGRSQALTDEEPAFNANHSSRTSSTAGCEPSTPFSLKLKMVKGLIAKGMKLYDSGNMIDAEICLKKALEHSSGLDNDFLMSLDLDSINYKLGLIYLELCEYRKAETCFCELIDRSAPIETELSIMSYLKLGKVCYSRNDDVRNDLDNALKYCETAATKFAKRFGETCELYNEAAALTAMAYMRKGCVMEAEAQLLLLPEQLQAQVRGQLPVSPPEPPKYSQIDPISPPKLRKMFSGFKRNSTSFDQSSLKELSVSTTVVELSDRRMKTSGEPNLENVQADPDQEPQMLLESKGFTGDYDVNKALTWAIKQGSEEIVKALLRGHRVRKKKLWLEKKADPNGSPKAGQSPLMLTVVQNQVKIARLLIEHRATLDKVDSNGKTPLSKATELQRIEILRLFPKELIQDFCDTSGVHSPLHFAAQNNHTETLLFFLNLGVTANARDSAGSTALKLAATRGHNLSVQLLLAHGADQTIADNNLDTPLMAAVRAGSQDCTTSFTQSPSCRNVVNAKNRRGETSLFIAVTQNYRQQVRILLQAGANLEIANQDGWTPLICSCHRGHVAVTDILLQAGADVNAASSKGSTPLDHAQARKYQAIVDLFRARAPNARNGSRRV